MRTPARRLSPLLGGLALSVLAVLASAVSSPAVTRTGVLRSAGSPSSARVPSGQRLAIKFRDDLRARVLSGRLVTSSVDDPQAAGVRALLDAAGVADVRPLFSLPEQYLDDLHARLEEATGEHLANQNSWVTIEVPRAVNRDALLRLLRHLPAVETAEPVPEPMPLPSPSLVSSQGYFLPGAAGGVDVAAANAVPGGRGSNVRVIDLEYAWNTSHEDLDRAGLPNALIPMRTFADPFYNPSDPVSSTNHGTAVLGVIGADDDSQGVTGIAPDADLRMVNTYAVEGYDPANAIALAHKNMSAGDVMLIEQQAFGPNGCGSDQFGCVALEWYQSVYDAIRLATADGIVVVEAAGNGSQNLDGAPYVQPFPAGRADSGAIIVGAGSVPGCSASPRSRLWFSDYGTRVDLQGWGQCVATTGYGTLYNNGANALYSNSFSGTSSAAALVAAVAAVVSSVAQEQQVGLTPVQLRQLLVVTGTPAPLGAAIGPLPDLGAAMRTFVPVAVLNAPSSAGPRSIVQLSAVGSTDPQGGALSYAWSLDGDGLFDDGTAPAISVPAPLARGNWTVRVQVTDPHGASTIATQTVSVEIVRDAVPVGPSPEATVPIREAAPDGAPGSIPVRGPAPAA